MPAARTPLGRRRVYEGRKGRRTEKRVLPHRNEHLAAVAPSLVQTADVRTANQLPGIAPIAIPQNASVRRAAPNQPMILLRSPTHLKEPVAAIEIAAPRQTKPSEPPSAGQNGDLRGAVELKPRPPTITNKSLSQWRLSLHRAQLEAGIPDAEIAESRMPHREMVKPELGEDAIPSGEKNLPRSDLAAEGRHRIAMTEKRAIRRVDARVRGATIEPRKRSCYEKELPPASVQASMISNRTMHLSLLRVAKNC